MNDDLASIRQDFPHASDWLLRKILRDVSRADRPAARGSASLKPTVKSILQLGLRLHYGYVSMAEEREQQRYFLAGLIEEQTDDYCNEKIA